MTMPSHWQKPAEGTYKLNVDDTYKEGRGGVSVIVQDHMGDIIAAASVPMQYLVGPDHAKITTILQALSFAYELDLLVFGIESDCAAMV